MAAPLEHCAHVLCYATPTATLQYVQPAGLPTSEITAAKCMTCSCHCVSITSRAHSYAHLQGNVIDDAAVLQLQVTKGQNQFLPTLAEPGLAQCLTARKPCSCCCRTCTSASMTSTQSSLVRAH